MGNKVWLRIGAELDLTEAELNASSQPACVNLTRSWRRPKGPVGQSAGTENSQK